jgi:hypothetical protein
MGKLLDDADVLRECKLDESEKVVHLFPKPRIVVKASTSNEPSSSDTTSSQHEPISSNIESDSGDNVNHDTHAHIPQIVLDDAMPSGIITTNELFEAQQRVKLLSFILLIISSMELLTLVTVFLGSDGSNGENADDYPPGDPTDYVTSLSSGYGSADGEQLRTWKQSDYADVVVSGLGVYVAMLGLKASTENTPELALRYFAGLVVVGFGWLGYYFYLSVSEGRKQQQNSNDPDGSGSESGSTAGDGSQAGGNVYANAAAGLLIPVMVWLTCFFRAWRFRVMLLEAQQDAFERHEEQHRQLQQDSTELALDQGEDPSLAEIV